EPIALNVRAQPPAGSANEDFVMSLTRPLLVSLALLSLMGCQHTRPAEEPMSSSPAETTPGKGIVLIEGARVFDGNEDLGVVTLVIRGAHLMAVVPEGVPLQAPADARRV